MDTLLMLARESTGFVLGLSLGVVLAVFLLANTLAVWQRDRDAWDREVEALEEDRRRLMAELARCRPIPRRKTERSGGQGWPFSRSRN